ncbi:MAG: hypothetical protein ACP5PA_01430 [Elusimicrobiales bacterium]
MMLLILVLYIFFCQNLFSFDFNDFIESLSSYDDILCASTSYIDVSDVKKEDKKLNVLKKELGIGFSQDEWNKFLEKVEKGDIVYSTPPTLNSTVEIDTSLPTLGPQIEFLDSGTSLNVSGRKVISLNYSGKKYINPQTTNIRNQSTSNLDITQQLQLRMQGRIGNKITVNVDYDDTKSDKQDISIVYQGEPQEVVQNVSFGDIDLSLPSTEFVSYNKQLFGIRADLKTGRFKGTIIGSRTKGQTKTKQFKGNTQFRTVDIPDTSYIRRKYYDITFSSTSFLPIKPGSEKVYIDQQTSQPIDGVIISSITADDITSQSVTYTGKFKLLTRGVDYTIDYNNGEIVFARSLNPQDVVIIDYQKSNGSWLRDENSSGRYKILKSYNDIYISNPSEKGWRNEIKTYYSIGQTNIVRDNGLGNFILKVQNLNRQEIGPFLNPPQKYPDTIEVDFEQGIIKLKKPFTSENDPTSPDPQTYSASPVTKRIIHIEFYYRINTFYLEPNIVLNSEVIRVDGKRLVKNQDYYIDYDSGFLTFYNSEIIAPESIIDIYYEVSPFGSSNQSLVGGRASYDFSRYFSVGSTLLYQSSNKQPKAPQITDIVSNLLVYDADTSLRDLNIFGLKTSLSAEVAGSALNPNVNENAIIDNMESSKQEDIASLDKNLWLIASNPSGVPSNADSIFTNTIEVEKKTINPSSPDNSKQQILEIDYDFSVSSEVSIVYVFSKIGIDFSRKNSIELTLKGSSTDYGPLLNLTLGEINEDSDGSGGVTLVCSNGRIIYNAPKTEDINCDGVLSPDEDKGWLYAPIGGGTRRIGENNGRIDTQDLDGNGKLDVGNPGIGGNFGYYAGNYFTDITSSLNTNEINFDSWHNWVFPLIIPSTEAYRWSNIKVARISLKKTPNTPIKGRIYLARLSVVGNTWNVSLSTNASESINVYSINNIDNPGYIPLFNAGGEITSAYNTLYGSVSQQKLSSGESNVMEQAIALDFSNWTSTSTSYVYRRFSVPIDISQHKEFKFFVYNKTPDSFASLYLKLGDVSNYFKLSIPLSFTGWRMFVIKQPDLNGDGLADRWISMDPSIRISTSGNFSLQSVAQIIVGIDIDDALSHNLSLYLNDIFLSKPIKKVGSARKVQGNFEIPGFVSFGGKHRYVDRMFQTPVSAITNQDSEENSGFFTLMKPSFFPTSYTFSRKITQTPNVYNTGNNNLVNLLQQGRVKNEDITARGTFAPGLIPKVDLSYSRNTTEYDILNRKDEKHNYSASTSFNSPLNFPLVPKNTSLSYTYIINRTNYSSLLNLPSNYNSDERINSYTAKLTFNILNFFDFNPNYSLSKTYERRSFSNSESFSYPKNLQQSSGFNSNLTIFRWLRPSISYNITTSENNNISVTTLTVAQISRFYNVGDIKNITRNANGGINLNISMSEITPRVKGLRTMVITSNYQLQDGDVWNNVERGFDSKRYLWIRKKLEPSSDFAIRQSATMRDSYSTGMRIQPFEGWNLLGRAKALETINITSNFAYSKQDSYATSILTRTKNKTLPDFVLSISQLEDMFSVSRWVRYMIANIRYSKNISEVVNNTEDTNKNFGFDLRFTLMNYLNTSLMYSNQTGEKKNLIANQITSYTNKKTFSLQGLFDVKAYRFTPRVDYSKDFARSTLGIVITNTTVITPSVLIRADMKLPKNVKLPFMRQTIFDNRIIWTTNTSYSIRRSPISVNDNNKLFSLTSTAEVEATKNLRLSINASFQRFWHKYLKQEDYISYQIGTNLILQF